MQDVSYQFAKFLQNFQHPFQRPAFIPKHPCNFVISHITSLKLHPRQLFNLFIHLPSQSKINVSIEAMKSLASLPWSSLHDLSTILFLTKLPLWVSSRTQYPSTEVEPMLHSVLVGRQSSPVIQDGARGKAKLEENNFEEARSKRSCGMVLLQRPYQGT